MEGLGCRMLLSFVACGAVAEGCRALPGTDLAQPSWDLPSFHHPLQRRWGFASLPRQPLSCRHSFPPPTLKPPCHCQSLFLLRCSPWRQSFPGRARRMLCD